MVAFLASFAFGQTWVIQQYYSGSSCSGFPIAIDYFSTTSSCSTMGCTSNGGVAFQQDCMSNAPPVPDNWIIRRDFTGNGCGTPNSFIASATSTCLPVMSGSNSWMLSCSGSTLTQQTWNGGGCTGSGAPPSVFGPGCTN